MNIVVLPGLDGTGMLTPKLRRTLDNGHTVTTLAYPPHLSRYADILEWAQSHLPDEDYVLVAESFSGPVAILIGSKAPARLKGIVFVATFAQRPRKLPVFLAHLLAIMPLHSGFVSNLAQPFLMGKWSNRAFTDQFRQAMRNVPASTLSKRLVSVLQVDVVDALKRIEVPVLYLRATRDRLVPARISRDFASDTARVRDVEGPHFLLQACADQSDLLISRFADSLE